MKSITNKAFIAGDWVIPKKLNGQIDVHDKYTMEPIGSVLRSAEDEIENALASAEIAFEKRLLGSAENRWELIGRLINELNGIREELINTLIMEIGKPRGLAAIEFDRSLQTLELSRAQTLTFAGDVVAMDYGQGIGRVSMTCLNPIGPILCVTPFNFPLNLLMHKVGPALAVGCPVIIKPSPLAPLTNQLVAMAMEKANFPKGTVSILNISDDHARTLSCDPRIKLISFTGSADVGWKIKQDNYRKKVMLELGGNAAAIVTENCDFKKAAKLLAISGNMYAGQICISTQRIFVHTQVRQRFEEELINQLQKIECGDPKLKHVSVGPMISKPHFERVKKWTDEAVSDGAKIVFQGRVDKDHNLLGPILLTNTTRTMNVRAQEVFGPVLTLEDYNEIEEAFSLVNDSKYGLQAGFFCNDIDQAKLAVKNLNVGAVVVNGAPSFRVDSMPYGGVKDSGFGREGVLYKMKELVEPRLMIF